MFKLPDGEHLSKSEMKHCFTKVPLTFFSTGLHGFKRILVLG